MLQRNSPLNIYFDLAIYIGFMIFVLALPFGRTTMILYGGLLLALFGWVGRIIHERKFKWRRTPLDVPIAVFLFLGLVASFFAPHRATSSLGYFWKLLRAVLLFYAVIHSRLGKRWKNVILAFIFAGGFSAVLGLWYYAHGTHLGIDFMFGIELKYESDLRHANAISERLRQVLKNNGVPLSQDAIFSSSRRDDEWRITDEKRDRIYAIRKDDNQLNIYMIEQRLAGTFKMPNDLGAYLTLLVPMTMGYLIVSWRTRQRWEFIALLGIVLCLMVANLLLTLTRSAWVGVFVAALCILIAFERRLLWGLLLIALLSPLLMPKHVKERFDTLIKQPPGFISERPHWWKTSGELIAKYPITGIGLGRFRHEYQLYAPPDMYHTPTPSHNIYLHVAVEQGIPSLLLFLWMLFLIFRQLFALRGNEDFWRLGLFVGGGGFLISALVYGLADHILHQRPLLIFWFVNGIIFYITSQNGENL